MRKIEMFTGIVAGTAPIVKIEDKDLIRSFTVDLGKYIDNLEIGASVALDGVCMTVVSIENNPSIGSPRTTKILAPREILPSPIACKIISCN